MAIIDVDLSKAENFDDGVPLEAFQKLRAEEPVYWQDEEDGTGFWSVTRYQDLKYVSTHPQEFSSWRGGTNLFDMPEKDLEMVRTMMINMDPPQHGKFRRIVSRGFTPKMIDDLEPMIKELAHEIIDSVADKGQCEFVNDIACRLPMEVICELMGVPKELRKEVYNLSNRLIGFDDPEYQSSMEDASLAAAEMFVVAEQVGDMKRKCPVQDLSSKILMGEVDGENLSPFEYDCFFLMLAIAGNETTRTVTSNAMTLFMEYPDQKQKLLDDMSLLPRAIEECLRYRPALIHFRRTATCDIELGGKQIRDGDKVLIWYPSVNRDADIFDDPDRFDITRQENDHLAFGVGEHYCLGATLARLQLTVIFEEILTRIPDMELDGPIRRLRSNFIDGIKEMPVRFTPENNGGRA